MLPRLEAEQVLQNAQSTGLGFGGGEEGKKSISILQAAAMGKYLPESKRVTGREFATMMGIPIRRKRRSITEKKEE